MLTYVKPWLANHRLPARGWNRGPRLTTIRPPSPRPRRSGRPDGAQVDGCTRCAMRGIEGGAAGGGSEERIEAAATDGSEHASIVRYAWEPAAHSPLCLTRAMGAADASVGLRILVAVPLGA